MINDRLEIYVKQAPISKIVVNQNSIDVVKGLKNPEIIRRIPIENNDFLQKYMSIPRYMYSIIEQEQDTICLNLSGYHHNDSGYIPNDEAFDNYNMEDYYNNHGYQIPCDDSTIYFKEYIDNRKSKLLIFGSKTINMHKAYIFDIIRDTEEFIDMKANDLKNSIGSPNSISTEFTLEFVKTDCVYVKSDSIQRYNDDNSKNWIKKINKKGNSIVTVNAKHGFIVTKENSN